ncbi:MAG: hypothetical protein ISS70_13090 [Phycisphaerae bacterium]|nr:hypothetical protein [Phycisphaerae bacterium]
MENVTLAVAAIFSVSVLFARPPYALAAYIICLLWYPNYLAVSVGTIDIFASRIVVVMLFLRCLSDGRIQNNFKWSKLDYIVLLSMIVYVVTYCLAVQTSKAIENRGGFLLDTWFAYMVVRYIVTDRATLVTVIKCAAPALGLLAILGVVESVTLWQPFAPLMRFCPWLPSAPLSMSIEEIRFGFGRAIGPFSHSILFGCGFAIFLPLVYYLRHEKGFWRSSAYVFSGLALLGALSSMSSGPWVMTIVVTFCLAMERHKVWVKPLCILAVLSCIFVAIASNRPFYHVIAEKANPLGGSSWHRARLIDLAIAHFDEWWLVGYGEQDPGWGPELGSGDFTDVTNEFVLAGVSYGIFGMIALCAVLATAFRCLIRVQKDRSDPRLVSLSWALFSILLALIVTWMSVSFFGQLMPLSYFVLGAIGSIDHISRVPRTLSMNDNRKLAVRRKRGRTIKNGCIDNHR